MSETNPATPPSGATPGSEASVITPPSTTTSPKTGDQPEGKVTIDLKEYRDLQRAKARSLSFDKRVALRSRSNSSEIMTNADGTPADPDVIEKLNESEKARVAAERKSLQLEVKGKVRDLLEQEEFKNLPSSTKALILKNPAMVTTAETLEEAMLDIEDFVREQVVGLEKTSGGASNAPDGVITPPPAGSGGPAPVVNADMEDVSKLSGPARSQAMIRNSLKKK